MRQIFILLVSLTCLQPALFSQEQDCQKFRTGNFQNIDHEGPSTLIKRTEKFQFEENPETGVKIKLKVEWLDECSYKLKFVKGNKVWNSQTHVPGSPDLIVKIIETGEDYYIQVAKFVGMDEVTYRSKIQIKE